MAETEWQGKTGSMTEVLIQVPVLTPYERAMVYNMEHNKHHSLAQVQEYLHWCKARGEMLERPYQPTLPVVDEATAVVEDVICRDMARPPFTPGLGEDTDEPRRSIA